MSSVGLLRRTLPPFMGPPSHDPVTSHTPRQGHHTGGEAFNIRIPGGHRHAAPSVPHVCDRRRELVDSESESRLFATPWTVAWRASLSMEFSREEYWSGYTQPREQTQVSRNAGGFFTS